MRFLNVLAGSAFALVIAACAQAPTLGGAARTETPAKPHPTTADYRRYIKGDVPAFSSARVYDWDAPDLSHVVVWTSASEAYLLTLFGACFGLDTTHTILLSAEGGTVRAGAAAVMIGGQRCPIQFVERLDARAIKVDGLH